LSRHSKRASMAAPARTDAAFHSLLEIACLSG
jgi:hypothetical protein